MSLNKRGMVQLSRRLLSDSKESQTWKWSRGNVGRKVFSKGWKHLEPRYPINLQERWHRTSVERLFHPSIIESVRTQEIGQTPSKEWRMGFFTQALSDLTEMSQEALELARLSPWHDIPFGFKDNINDQLLFNYINEIPKYDSAKMECATDEDWNPIKQDIKKGNLRFFKYKNGELPFNYGFIPQTWEDPKLSSAYSDIKDLTGDNDPIDFCELSEEPLPRGIVVPCKIIAVLGLIDEGETDWKIIGLRADHPKINQVNTMTDATNVLGINYSDLILDWFRYYKTADGKPENSFTHNSTYQSSEMAIEIIEETHRHWLNLLLGAATNPKNKLNLTSVTQKNLIAQGLTSTQGNNAEIDLPTIEYPRYDDWMAQTTRQVNDMDSAQEEYQIDEETPDQRRR